MATEELLEIDWHTLTKELGEKFAQRAATDDISGSFVKENYEDLKKHRYFSAMIPEELGGGGLSHKQMSDIIRTIAHYSGSTALALSMHQHLVAAAIWKYKNQGEVSPAFARVVKDQVVLVSTGARDWLDSNGEMEKVDGGYKLTAKKHFASQSIYGNIAITSAPYFNEKGQWNVLHFSVPLSANGVSILDDWDTMGMRSTGSNTIVFKDVFIPDAAIALNRPRNGYHTVWDIVLTVAMPLIMSAYVGLAERALEIATEIGSKYKRNEKHMPYMLGKMNNTLLGAKAQLEAMLNITDNFNFSPQENNTNKILSYKTNISDACISTVSQAMEALGGQSFYKANELERIFRDVNAAPFHPLPKWEQYEFTGKRLLSKK